MNRTTETLFLRLDPALARTVRDQAKARSTTISALAEDALKAYVNDTTSADHREKLLQATEAALLTRMEQRLNQLLTNVRGLYAKEAMDTAQILELVKYIVALGTNDERKLTSVINGSRQEAHKRISARAPWPAPIPPEVEAKLATLEQEKAHMATTISNLKQQIATLDGQIKTYQAGQEELRAALSHAKDDAAWARREGKDMQMRYDKAIQLFEAQGMLKRKPIREFLSEMGVGPWE